MAIRFNHTIVAARNREESARYFTELFGLEPAREFGHFLAVTLEHGVSLDFAKAPDDQPIHPQHYAFLVDEEEFDADLRPHPRSAANSIGLTRGAPGQARSITTTVGAGCTSRTRPATTSRSSPGRTDRAADVDGGS